MGSKESGCGGLILIIGVIYLLSDCSGDKKSDTIDPNGPQALYLKASEGDVMSLTRLIAAKGKEAGVYQEKMGDDLQWSNWKRAEVCWEAAAANGVQDGGPEWAYLYYAVKYWELSVGTISALLLFFLYCLFRKKSPGKPAPTRRRKAEPAPRPQESPITPEAVPMPQTVPNGCVLLIDTNIWMDEKLTEWFRNLPSLAKRHNWTLHIEKIVLGELKGLSNNENKERAGNARMGMSRMETLQELQGRRVRLEDNAIRGKDANADSVLLRVAAKTPHAIIITNDRELRILAKSQGTTAIGSAKFGNIR